MNDMLTILLAGGIGSGKSTVSHYLRSRGVPVYDSDSNTKALYDKDPELVLSLAKAMGCSLVRADGTFDRKRLAEVIFNSPAKLEECERIVHPAVLKDIEAWKLKALNEAVKWCGYCGPRPFVCIESAIALDKPIFDHVYDISVYVDAPEELRIQRVALRDKQPMRKIIERIHCQALHHKQPDYILINDGSVIDLQEKTDGLFSRIINERQRITL